MTKSESRKTVTATTDQHRRTPTTMNHAGETTDQHRRTPTVNREPEGTATAFRSPETGGCTRSPESGHENTKATKEGRVRQNGASDNQHARTETHHEDHKEHKGEPMDSSTHRLLCAFRAFVAFVVNSGGLDL